VIKINNVEIEYEEIKRPIKKIKAPALMGNMLEFEIDNGMLLIRTVSRNGGISSLFVEKDIATSIAQTLTQLVKQL